MNFTHDHGDPHHICMWEGPSYEPSAATVLNKVLNEEKKTHLQEIQRLRALLDQNNILWMKGPPKSVANQNTQRMMTRRASLAPQLTSTKPSPRLPTEIIIRILGYALKSTTPIIDPFWKVRPDNLTKDEKVPRRICVNFLLTCKAFHVEGTRLIFANNEFVFTQVPALENFARFSADLRCTVKNVTLRVVGRYYDDFARKQQLTGNAFYHNNIPALTLHVSGRPKGILPDKGIESYCWLQLIDFLKAFSVPDQNRIYSKLFPSLKSMRIDLVNFCEHIPFPGPSYISVLRWHAGRVVDELVVTGGPDEELGNGEEQLLGRLVRDEGVVASGCAAFVSIKNGLKRLPGYGLSLHVVRANESSTSARLKKVIHPEGGEPPRSKYPLGTTIWKYVSDYTGHAREWVEFHRFCGYPVTECGELHSDSEMDEDEDDEEGWENDF